MHRRTFLSLFAVSGLAGLTGCQPSQIRQSIHSAKQLSKGNLPGAVAAHIPVTGIAQIDQLVKRQIESLVAELAKTWGDKKVASPKEYVKYTEQYQSRALVNFNNGQIRVETLINQAPKTALKAAIVSTLLTPENPAKVDLLSDKTIVTGQQPFLHGLVVDQDSKAIATEWRAKRYADFLIKTAYQSDRYNQKPRHFVTFSMVKNHTQSQQRHYAAQVKRQSQRFKLEPALIYAIIETESAFNPYAMSHIPAYGLMQIVPQSAGRDAYRFLYKKDGTPSKNYLFQADNNIEMGAVYLHLLFSRYLATIQNPQSQEYCCIAAYNTGSGNVLKAFHSDRQQAVSKINTLSADQVYRHLRNHLTYQEARHYLEKVTRKKQAYL